LRRIRLPAFCGFRGPRFQSTSPTSNDTSSRYRLACCTGQRLSQSAHRGLQPPHLHGISYTAAPAHRVGAECSRFFPRTPGSFHSSHLSMTCHVYSWPSAVSVCALVARNPNKWVLPTLPRAGINDAYASPVSFPSPTAGHFLPEWLSSSPNLLSKNGMSRTGGLHPRALDVAAPAPLRARGFTGLRRVGGPARGHPPR
jgi:hypothetical protein